MQNSHTCRRWCRQMIIRMTVMMSVIDELGFMHWHFCKMNRSSFKIFLQVFFCHIQRMFQLKQTVIQATVGHWCQQRKTAVSQVFGAVGDGTKAVIEAFWWSLITKDLKLSSWEEKRFFKSLYKFLYFFLWRVRLTATNTTLWIKYCFRKSDFFFCFSSFFKKK